MPKTGKETLDELSRLESGAAPAPWEVVVSPVDCEVSVDRVYEAGDGTIFNQRRPGNWKCLLSMEEQGDIENGALIPAMRNALPGLISDSKDLHRLQADLRYIVEMSRARMESPEMILSALDSLLLEM